MYLNNNFNILNILRKYLYKIYVILFQILLIRIFKIDLSMTIKLKLINSKLIIIIKTI